MGKLFESTKPEEYYTETISELQSQVHRLITQQENLIKALEQSAMLLTSIKGMVQTEEN